ncbi:uncharacterized protein LOC131165355 [Malania oleifera]|uniref:uncharacterized protein LOC131165355 n=1 Tax=Malania oleifera TaxID=397392 RepID=UPI0025AE031B|nr:uncharacterized protein LOC131165355 [Malania oleifera]
MPSPNTKKEVRSFLGRLNYIARFISQLTTTCETIFKLLRKNNPERWNEECQEAFKKIKKYILNPSILVPPIPGRPLILYLAISENSMGCAIKGSVIAEYLADRAVEDCQPMEFDFLDKDINSISQEEEDHKGCTILFDRAVNVWGHGIGAILISPEGEHYLITVKLTFPCTNNIAEYEACILGLQAAIDRGIKELDVKGDSALVIHQLPREGETRDSKLVPYQEYIQEMIEGFDGISFAHLPRENNLIPDALATLTGFV